MLSFLSVKPQSVRVSLVDNYTAILPYYTYGVTCIVRRAYPACSVTWVWPEGVDKLDSTESLDGTNVITTEAELSLNVSRKVNGKEVTCKAVCAEVDFNQADVHVIFVPCKYINHYKVYVLNGDICVYKLSFGFRTNISVKLSVTI